MEMDIVGFVLYILYLIYGALYESQTGFFKASLGLMVLSMFALYFGFEIGVAFAIIALLLTIFSTLLDIKYRLFDKHNET